VGKYKIITANIVDVQKKILVALLELFFSIRL